MTTIMNKSMHGTRGDSVGAAGRSLKGLLAYRRQYDVTRAVLAVLCGILAIAAVVGLGITIFLNDGGSIIITIIAALLAMMGRYVARSHGASVLFGSAIAACAASVWMKFSIPVGWAPTLVAGAMIAVTLLQMNSRKSRLPVTPTAVICHWLMATGLFAVQWFGPVAVWSAAVIVAVVTLVQCDLPGYLAFRRAAKRSGIPAWRKRMKRKKVGLRPPVSMHRENLENGLEAEKATAEVLDTLGPEYVVLHSRAVPGSNADIDHIVIGPHGVAIVDSKFRSGVLELRERTAETAAHMRQLKLTNALKKLDGLPDDVSDDALDSEELAARYGAYEALVASTLEDDPWDEWYLNGSPANASLMSSVAWETAMVEEALVVPEGTKLPVALSMYGARMSDEHAEVLAFADNGEVIRLVSTVQYTAVADWIRGLPTKITNDQMVADLACVVDHLFPRK